jgi:hypothetical protein
MAGSYCELRFWWRVIWNIRNIRIIFIFRFGWSGWDLWIFRFKWIIRFFWFFRDLWFFWIVRNRGFIRHVRFEWIVRISWDLWFFWIVRNRGIIRHVRWNWSNWSNRSWFSVRHCWI